MAEAVHVEPHGTHPPKERGEVVLLAGGNADHLGLDVGPQVDDPLLAQPQPVDLIQGTRKRHQQRRRGAKPGPCRRLAVGRDIHTRPGLVVPQGLLDQIQLAAHRHHSQAVRFLTHIHVLRADHDPGIVSLLNAHMHPDINRRVDREPPALKQIQRIHIQRTAGQVDTGGNCYIYLHCNTPSSSESGDTTSRPTRSRGSLPRRRRQAAST